MIRTRLLAVALLATASTLVAQVSRKDWGKTSNGTPVSLYTLKDKALTVQITTFGARVVSIEAPDRAGKQADVVLGYDNLGAYEADHSTYFGAIVGRYGNRIAHGTFTIDGKTFHVPTNDGENALHGGTTGFDHKVWTGKEIPNGVEMSLVSPNGDMGFPGQLTVHVRYILEGNSLQIHYTATTTAPTVVNLTNHSYFNLNGDGHGTILNHLLMIKANSYTPIRKGLIPTGQIAPVQGTPFDFRQPTPIGARINVHNEQLELAGGYDHNWVLSDAAKPGLHLSATAYDPETGRTLTETTTEPGVQFYSGNFLNGTQHGKYGVSYPKHAAFCLETQHFPDSPNEPEFPSTVLRPGQTLHSETVFTFGTRK